MWILLRFSRIHFNPLPPYGGRRTFLLMLLVYRIFQSTPSVWRETHDRTNLDDYRKISIHSLRMEGDHVNEISSTSCVYFNPLPPYGGRPAL